MTSDGLKLRCHSIARSTAFRCVPAAGEAPSEELLAPTSHASVGFVATNPGRGMSLMGRVRESAVWCSAHSIKVRNEWCSTTS